jgi:hypothetical protein
MTRRERERARRAAAFIAIASAPLRPDTEPNRWRALQRWRGDEDEAQEHNPQHPSRDGADVTHPLNGLIIQALNNITNQEIAEADEVRKEIAQRGTYWAGNEIWKLRRQVAALRKRLAQGE